MLGEKRISDDWPGAAVCEAGAFRPQGIPRLYILSDAADVSERAQAALVKLYPAFVATRISPRAAMEAKE